MVKTTESFFIAFDGPALKNHEMDVRELAPALVALADLFEVANHLATPERAKIVVNVKGSFKEGSFIVELNVVRDVLEQLLGFLSSPYTISAATLLQLTGISPIHDIPGALQIIKATLRGKITSVKEVNDKITIIEITRPAENGEDELISIQTDKRVIPLLKNGNFRKFVSDLIYEPLSKPGIDQIKVKNSAGETVFVVEDEEKEAFGHLLVESEELGNVETIEYLQLVVVNFKENNKWRFSKGSEIFYAKMLDSDFLDRVAKNEELFSKDDILKVKLRMKQYINSKSELVAEYEIVKVFEHRAAAVQLKLPS